MAKNKETSTSKPMGATPSKEEQKPVEVPAHAKGGSRLLPPPPQEFFLALEPLGARVDFEPPTTYLPLFVTSGSNRQAVLPLGFKTDRYKSFKWSPRADDYLHYEGKFGRLLIKVSITTVGVEIYQDHGYYWYRLFYEWLQTGDRLCHSKAKFRKARWSTFDAVPNHLWDVSTHFDIYATTTGRAGIVDPRLLASKTPTPQTIFEQADSVGTLFPADFYANASGPPPGVAA
jgi:hypothetical protein